MSTTTHTNPQDDGWQVMQSLLYFFRWALKGAGLLGYLLSVVITVLFNWQSADTLHMQVIWALVGFVQVTFEFICIVTGGLMLFRIGRWFPLTVKNMAFKVFGAFILALGLSLVVWSILSTYGANSSSVAESVAVGQTEQQKLNTLTALTQAAQQNAAAVQNSAQARIDNANSYAGKWKTRKEEQLDLAGADAKMALQQTGTMLNQIEGLMGNIDEEKINRRNSVQQVIITMSTLGFSEASIELTLLLMRSIQLESIVIVVSAFLLMMSIDLRSGTMIKLQKTVGEAPPKTENPTNNYNIDPTKVGGLSMNTKPTASVGSMHVGATGFAPQTQRFAPVTGELQNTGEPAPQTAVSPATSTIDRLKAAAIKGAEQGISKAAEINTIANETAPQRQASANKLIDTAEKVAEKFRTRPTNIDPRWLKAAKHPEFPAVFAAIVTGDCPPVQNQIAVKRKLCNNHKALQIMELMWIYHWLDKVEKTGRFQLPVQHPRLKLTLPISSEQVSQHVKIIKALAEGATNKEGTNA